MKEVAELVNDVLRPGGHAVMFCSPVQFNEWHGLLQGEIDEEGRRTFNTDPHPMALVNTPGHYYGRIRKKTTALHAVTSWAVHATKTGLANDDFELIDYSESRIYTLHKSGLDKCNRRGRSFEAWRTLDEEIWTWDKCGPTP